MKTAIGPMDVNLTPHATATPDPQRGRYAIAKQYHGALEASGTGEMLTGGDPKTGSAGYVAIERVTGTLAGRAGSFLLQHSGTMSAGQTALSIAVIAGSGSGELTGLAGTMGIDVAAGGQHTYRFEYTLERA